MAQMVKNLPVNVGDLGSIPRLGRSPGGGHSYCGITFFNLITVLQGQISFVPL